MNREINSFTGTGLEISEFYLGRLKVIERDHKSVIYLCEFESPHINTAGI